LFQRSSKSYLVSKKYIIDFHFGKYFNYLKSNYFKNNNSNIEGKILLFQRSSNRY